jgi:hypothetical protein
MENPPGWSRSLFSGEEGASMLRITWMAVFVGLLACAFLASSPAQEKRAAPVLKWEYKVLTQAQLDNAKGLPQLGEEGWELVAVEGELREPIRVSDFKFGGNVTNNRVRERTYYFKRPK